MWILHFSISQLDIIKSRLKFAVDLATGITLPAKVYFIASNWPGVFKWTTYKNNFLLLSLHKQLPSIVVTQTTFSCIVVTQRTFSSIVVTQTTSFFCCYTNNFLLLLLHKQLPSIVVTQTTSLYCYTKKLPSIVVTTTSLDA